MDTTYLSSAIATDDLIALAKQLDPDVDIICTDRKLLVECFAHFRSAVATSLSYFDADNFDGYLSGACVIALPSLADQITAPLKIFTSDPRRLFIEIASNLIDEYGLDYDRLDTLFPRPNKTGKNRIHPSAMIMDGSFIGNGCNIGPNVVILPGTVVEDNVTIKSGAIIGESGAAIHVLADRTLSQPHVGRVWIQSGTEIGSQANIVCGIFGATRVGPRCIVGNQVNIGHNVTIDEGVWLGAGSVIGGFTQIGAFANIGMGTVCRNGVSLGTECNVAMGSVVSKTVPDYGSCFGNPAKLTPVRLSAGPSKNYREKNA